jgi:hypothetical protein
MWNGIFQSLILFVSWDPMAILPSKSCSSGPISLFTVGVLGDYHQKRWWVLRCLRWTGLLSGAKAIMGCSCQDPLGTPPICTSITYGRSKMEGAMLSLTYLALAEGPPLAQDSWLSAFLPINNTLRIRYTLPNCITYLPTPGPWLDRQNGVNGHLQLHSPHQKKRNDGRGEERR